MDHSRLRLECLCCGLIFPADGLKHPDDIADRECPHCGAPELELRAYGMPLPVARACKGCASVIPAARLAAQRKARFCVPCQDQLEHGLLPPKLQKDPCPLCGAPLVVREGKLGRSKRVFLGCSNYGVTGCQGTVDEPWRPLLLVAQ